MGHVDGVVVVTVIIFIIGVVFDAGQKAARISMLEKAAAEINAKLDRLLERRAAPRGRGENQRGSADDRKLT